MPEDKAERLARVLRKSVETRRYRPGEPIPSERTLSEHYKVSRTTVRRAIEGLVAAGLLARRPGAGTYAVDLAAVRPARVENPSTIAFVVPTFSNPFYGEMIDGIEQEARGLGLRVLAGQSNYEPRRENEYLARYAVDATVAGTILVPARIDVAMPGARQLARQGKPLVFVGRWPDGIGSDCITANYRIGAKLAISHLIALGHHRIAYVEGLPHLPGFSPFEGYEDAMLGAGVAVDEALVRVLDYPSEQAGLEAVRALVAANVAFTAVFARNDVTASGVMRGLKEASLFIPRDVSVLSMNDSELARHMDPPLSGIDPFPLELGRQAFRLLHDRLSGHYGGPMRRIAIDPALVIRQSCAPLAAHSRPRRVAL